MATEVTVNSPSSENQRLLNAALAWLRFPMAFLIVVLHTTLWEDLQDGVGGCEWRAYELFVCAAHNLTQIAIPLFFCVSGYYFFYRVERFCASVYFGKLKKRFRTLLVPYLFWTIIIFLLECGLRWLLGLRAPYSQYLLDSPLGWLKLTFGVPDYGYFPVTRPLWFVRNLMVLVFLSPLFYVGALRLRWLFPLLFLALRLAFGEGAFFCRFTDCLFFGLGATAAILKTDVLAMLARFKWLVLLLPLAGFVYCNLDWPQGKQIFILSALPGVVLGAAICFRRGWLRPTHTLASASFFVFAAHRFMDWPGSMQDVARLYLPADTTLWAYVEFVVAPILTTAVCLAAFLLMRRVAPRFLGLVSGGRV